MFSDHENCLLLFLKRYTFGMMNVTKYIVRDAVFIG